MGLRHLLDTHILSDLVRHPRGAVAKRIAREGEDSVCTSLIVSCELRFGAAKKASARLSAQREAVLSALAIVPDEEPADRHYAQRRRSLEQAGTSIGPNDMLIAAHALALGLTVVTANVQAFSRVPGLIVAHWL
jgi:tRNA(fMet)-specific endonuclease VapC